MNRKCQQCHSDYVISDDDLSFYQKISPEIGGNKYLVPSPKLCQDCRFRRRLSMRNERRLYQKKSDKSGEMIITTYDQDSPYQVFGQKEWWADDWDARDFGQEFDFGRPFFEQFMQLQKKVPKIALININPENSDYLNCAAYNKDSYMSFDVGWNQKVMFSRTIYNSTSIVDCIYCKDNCDNLYQCAGCSNLTNSRFCLDSANGANCFYSYNLKGCRDCLFCSNLRNKQYCIDNQQYTKEEYDEQIKKYDFGSYSESKKLSEKFLDVFNNAIRPYADLLNCENCTGDYLLNCKNSQTCFDAAKLENCKYMYGSPGGKDCYDDCFSGVDNCQMNLETIGSDNPYHCLFIYACWSGCRDLLYCDFCHSSNNCFGCSGMRKAEYCILNKQYSKEEYEKLVPRIIEHMTKTGEWGEFFPTSISPFAYNETVANDYFPATREQVTEIGGRWKEIVDTMVKTSEYLIPDKIKQVGEDIVNQVLECEITKRPYKIQPQELVFYLQNNIPIPRRHPDQRYAERWQLINPWRLFHRQCMCEGQGAGAKGQGSSSKGRGASGGCSHVGRCVEEFETTYAPDKKVRVYCKECYQKTIM